MYARHKKQIMTTSFYEQTTREMQCNYTIVIVFRKTVTWTSNNTQFTWDKISYSLGISQRYAMLLLMESRG